MTHRYSDKEIAILRTGGAKLAQLTEQIGSELAVGMTVHDIEMRTRELVIQAGGESGTVGYKPRGAAYPFPAYACVSVNDEVAHGIAWNNPYVLADGDIVSLDIIMKYQNMFVDICRSWGIGTISQADQQLLTAARAATDAAIQQAVVGNTVDDIGRAAEQTARKYDCITVKELGGHGLGRKIHMQPFIPNFAGSGYTDAIRTRMVLAIEPILTRKDWRIVLGDDQWVYRTACGQKSAQFEETVLVTEHGPEILTQPNGA